MNRRQIKKDATETVNKDGAINQLTDIRVQEVSVVDLAANRRKFLVTKAGEGEDRDAVAARVAAKIAARGPATPGADLDAAEKNKAAVPAAAVSTETVVAPVVQPPAAVVEAAKTVTPAAPAAVAPSTPAAPAAGGEAEGLEALRKTLTAEVTPLADGTIAIAVTETPIVPSNPAVPPGTVDRVKTAVIAGTDAIIERLNQFKTAVSNSQGSWSDSGTPGEMYSLWYIRDMIAALWDIGGPKWEIEIAVSEAISEPSISIELAADATPAQKAAHKAITTARYGKLVAVHRALNYCAGDMKSLIKELKAAGLKAPEEMIEIVDASKAIPTATVDASKAAAPVVVAAVPEKDIFADPRVVEMQEALKKNATAIAGLQQIVGDQAAIIEKARGTITPSNGNNDTDVQKSGQPEKKSGNVVLWADDLAGRKF